ncbi:MAG: hypothetical protein Q9M89_10735 [Persephonella sp.]|nr:hypothetical protein [Persephonella sp.]
MKVGMVSLGCPKNLVDTELLLGKLKAGKVQIVSDLKEADVVIINTCGFIDLKCCINKPQVLICSFISSSGSLLLQ